MKLIFVNIFHFPKGGGLHLKVLQCQNTPLQVQKYYHNMYIKYYPLCRMAPAILLYITGPELLTHMIADVQVAHLNVLNLQQ